MIAKKYFVVIILLSLVSVRVNAQAFQFQQTFTFIIKTTAQSPAHWYLEIENLCGVDTLLRWKADLSQIPAGWTITFDDEDHYYPNVQHGDSADFTLFDSLAFPQKLIIGAFTNNIPASVSAFFYVWNPADTAAPVMLEYAFDITVGLNDIQAGPDFIFQDGIYRFSGSVKYTVVNVAGQEMQSGTSNTLYTAILPAGIYVLLWYDRGLNHARRFCVPGY